MIVTHERDVIAQVDSYTPSPYVLAPSLAERMRTIWRTVTLTPARAALTMFSAVMSILVVFSLRPMTVRTTDVGGTLTMRCGLQFFVGGSDSLVVQEVCRNEYAGRALLFTFSVTALIAALIALGVLVTKPHLEHRPASVASSWRQFVDTPLRASLATLAALTFLAAIVALTPVRIHGSDSVGPYSAHCGISYYVAGNESARIEQACRRAYRDHAILLFVSVGVFSGAAGALVVLARRERH